YRPSLWALGLRRALEREVTWLNTPLSASRVIETALTAREHCRRSSSDGPASVPQRGEWQHPDRPARRGSPAAGEDRPDRRSVARRGPQPNFYGPFSRVA